MDHIYFYIIQFLPLNWKSEIASRKSGNYHATPCHQMTRVCTSLWCLGSMYVMLFIVHTKLLGTYVDR